MTSGSPPSSPEPLFALLAGMVRPLEGVDRNQPGYENAKGWNAALRQVADYVHGGAIAAPPSSPEPLRQVVESHIADLEHFARVRRDPTRGEIEKAIEELRAALAAPPSSTPPEEKS